MVSLEWSATRDKNWRSSFKVSLFGRGNVRQRRERASFCWRVGNSRMRERERERGRERGKRRERDLKLIAIIIHKLESWVILTAFTKK